MLCKASTMQTDIVQKQQKTQKPQVPLKSGAIMLDMYGKNGIKFPLHITICYLKDIPTKYWNDIISCIIKNYRGVLGKHTKYNVNFIRWGEYSDKVFAKSADADSIDLDSIRSNIFYDISKKYGKFIDTSRYNTGLPPMHCNVENIIPRPSMTKVPIYKDVTFAIRK